LKNSAFEDEDRDIIYRLFGETPISRWNLVNEILRNNNANFSSVLFPGVGHEMNTNLLIEFLNSNK